MDLETVLTHLAAHLTDQVGMDFSFAWSLDFSESPPGGDDPVGYVVPGNASAAPASREVTQINQDVEVFVVWSLSEPPADHGGQRTVEVASALGKWIGPGGEVVTAISTDLLAFDRPGRPLVGIRVTATIAGE